tara:strand:+ start:611 stop:1198 length:588 start_codon:yes stop_codon:yes gene_type:complete
MFNGIIYSTGKIIYLRKNYKSISLGIQTRLNFRKKDIGSSVSCNGVCLTIENIKKNKIYFYVSNETLSRSNFKLAKLGDLINLEKSLIYGQRISGHFVQGHVDTIAKINKITLKDKTWIIIFTLKDKKLSKFLIEKASISINGVSLTISKVNRDFFEVNVIPHTLKLTNLKNLRVKKIVNVELDIFAKYMLKISK